MAVHDRGYLIASADDGAFTFFRPDGTPLQPCPPLPAPDGHIGDVHDAEVTPDTIIPPWSGERLDLDYAIYTCLANEKVLKDRAAGRVQAEKPAECCPHFGVPVELFVSPHRDGAPLYLPVAV